MTKEEQLEFIKQAVGRIDPDEVDILADYASRVPKNGIILDIGTAAGKSCFALTWGSHPSVKVYTVDPITGGQFFAYREELGYNDRVIYFQKRSQDLGKEWKLPLDLFFDDGVHDYLSVHENIELFCPWVKKDGWCLFHDYTNYRSVGEAINEGEGKWYKKDKIYELIYAGQKI